MYYISPNIVTLIKFRLAHFDVVFESISSNPASDTPRQYLNEITILELITFYTFIQD